VNGRSRPDGRAGTRLTHGQEDRDRLKVTFDTVADRYHQARPDYPEELYAELVCLAGLRSADRLLEIGCGTGKATVPLAERGFAITCLEPGPRLAATARQNLARYPLVQIVEQGFENWQPSGCKPFDLVFAATAWHWIDPGVGYRQAWRLLRPGGHLAIWAAEHVFPPGGDPFFREIQEIYDEIDDGMPPGTGYFAPGEQPDDRAVIEDSGLFTVVAIRHFDWEISYSAQQYIALLDTFSSHIDMAGWQRDRLYGEIRRRLAARPDGKVRRHWGAVLQLAVRRDEPAMAAG
jgi:SAM-dependent methyltransferase